MTSNLAANTKGDFYWRLKYLMPRAPRNPVDETVLTAKHKRVSPIGAIAKREHEHEIFNFLAVIYQKKTLPIQWARGFLYSFESIKTLFLLKSNTYIIVGYKN